MESGSSAEVTLDISFGFDDPNFSDRTLLLKIIGDAHCDGDRSHRLWNVKRRRIDGLLNNTSADTTLSQPQRVKTIHITSLILAARSQFFLKLFSNDIQESEQKHVTLQIEALEEASFMNLLEYIYSNNLPTSLDALLDLLLTADKFEVNSCLRDCTRALLYIPMTCKLASDYLNLPPSLLMSTTVQPLIEAAKNFLVAKFKDLSKFKEELLNMSLLSLQAVLSSDDLPVTSECVVYDFVLTWVHKHYPDLEGRREILKTHLLHLVRFPFMTTTELTEKVQTCSDIDPEYASKIVIRALCFKAETASLRKLCLAAEKDNTTPRQFVERAYIYRPVKVVELELPHPQSVVYFDLTRKELNRIFPGGDVWSETFHLDGRELNLCASCCVNVFSNQHYFEMALDISSTSTVTYEFSVKKKPHEDFERWFRGCHEFIAVGILKYPLHTEEWTGFMGNNSSYFINDILHVRAEFTI